MHGDASSRRPAARAPLEVSVQTGVHGHGDSHTDADDTDTDDDTRDVDFTPDIWKDWVPPPDLSDVFKTLAGLSSPHAWVESSTLGPSIKGVLKSWSSPTFGFRPPQRGTCLHPAFDKLTKECKAFVKHAFNCVAASFAAAHAVSHASTYVQQFMKNLPDLFDETAKPSWAAFCEKAETAVKDQAISLLQDTSKCLAHMVGRSVSIIRFGPGLFTMSTPLFSLCFDLRPLPLTSISAIRLCKLPHRSISPSCPLGQKGFLYYCGSWQAQVHCAWRVHFRRSRLILLRSAQRSGKRQWLLQPRASGQSQVTSSPIASLSSAHRHHRHFGAAGSNNVSASGGSSRRRRSLISFSDQMGLHWRPPVRPQHPRMVTPFRSFGLRLSLFLYLHNTRFSRSRNRSSSTRSWRP